jgi:hypothetical protein
MDAVAITTRRVFAMCNEDLAKPFSVVNRADVTGLDISTNGETKALTLIRADGSTISYGEIADDPEQLRRIMFARATGGAAGAD